MCTDTIKVAVSKVWIINASPHPIQICPNHQLLFSTKNGLFSTGPVLSNISIFDQKSFVPKWFPNTLGTTKMSNGHNTDDCRSAKEDILEKSLTDATNVINVTFCHFECILHRYDQSSSVNGMAY